MTLMTSKKSPIQNPIRCLAKGRQQKSFRITRTNPC